MAYCEHVAGIVPVKPSSKGCEDCLNIGGRSVHLRICENCGYVGGCDNSPNRHATKHFQLRDHPMIKSFEPGEEWLYCYADDIFFETLPAAK